MKNFVITLLLGAAIGFGCAKAIDQPAVAETAQAPSANEFAALPEGTIVSVRFLEINGELNKEEALEIGKELSDVFNEAVPGVTWQMTGFMNFGQHAEHLGMLTLIPDLATHNSYFSGDESAKWRTISERPEVKAAMAKYEETFTEEYAGNMIVK
ncbi:MAG: hypothetical protein R2834_00960 [Rhodothermales bacterium]